MWEAILFATKGIFIDPMHSHPYENCNQTLTWIKEPENFEEKDRFQNE